MAHDQLAIIWVLADLCIAAHKLSISPPQETIRQRLRIDHEIDISLATLNRWLKGLQAHRLIIRKSIHNRAPNGKTIVNATQYKLTAKSKKLIISLGQEATALFEKFPEQKEALL